MSKYTIKVSADWERQAFEVTCNVDDETVQVIIADILEKLHRAYSHEQGNDMPVPSSKPPQGDSKAKG